tara:strand:- start:3145 stop:3900 length:756 start_codon:yes stop_codon:yes gene_type:complete
MAVPTSRATLIDYCKRRLGEPVIEVNVDEDQLEDRVDEALQYYQEYHSDATVRTFLKHEVTADDVSNEFIPIASNILFVSRLLPLTSSFNTSRNFFDIKYQMMLNDIADLMNFAGDLAYYEQMQQYLSLLDMKLNGHPQTQFARRQNRLYIFGDFADKDIKAGDFLLAEVYTIVDPTTHTSVFNDIFIKEYTTALIKQQWGTNLIKFDGMQLPGGVVLNGRQIYDDATGEIERLRESMRLEQELPPDFFVG